MKANWLVDFAVQVKKSGSGGLRWPALLAATLLIAACQTVQTTQPGLVGVTRAQQMGYMVSAEEMDATSEKAYKQKLQDAAKKNQLNRDQAMLERVQTIAHRLIAQTPVFREDARSWKWEINVFQSDEVNAFCMAGGKIGVYSGLITKLQITDAELAAVMGHEISHALREHVREQVSSQYAAQLPGLAVTILTGSQALGQLGDIFSDVTFSLPRSREAEAEADIMGVELAARAGYDPHAAISLWEKMNRLGDGRPPEFLSTHPSPENRAQVLARTSDIVMPLYRQSAGRK